MADVASMFVSLVVGGLLGRWGTLAVEKERLVFERRVDLVSQFLWKASKYTAEHVSGAVEQPDNVGKKKQKLVRLSHQTRLLLPDRLDEQVDKQIEDYVHALIVVDGEPRNYPRSDALAGQLNEDLTGLRDDLKRHISGSWPVLRLRKATARVERLLPGD